MGFSFAIGVIFARFQAGGNFCFIYESFSRFETGEPRVSAYSLRTQFAIPSGPGALVELKDYSLLYTNIDEVIFMPKGGTSSELSFKICKS